jgi:hypothetical protein
MLAEMLTVVLLQTRIAYEQIVGCNGSATCISLVQAVSLPAQQITPKCRFRMITLYICAEPLSKDTCIPSGKTIETPMGICYGARQ